MQLPLFVTLFGGECVVHVAGWHECIMTGEHRLRPTAAPYFWLHPRDRHYIIQHRIPVLVSHLI